METKRDTIQIIGTLMQQPQILSQTDRYSLSIKDFASNFEKYLFDTIEGLYYNGAKVIHIIDIENAIENNQAAKRVYEQNKGHEYLEDALEFTELNNFDYYYGHLKKINALRQLKQKGYDISPFYRENPLDVESIKINEQFEKLTLDEIFETISKTILKIRQEFTSDELSETKNVYDGIDDLLDEGAIGADIGMPLQGQITTMVMSGARRGTFMLRSGSSGTGKTRNFVADSCFLAFPFRFNPETRQWEQKGNAEKVLYIVTEQNIKEIQRMVLAYITGINESKFRYGQFSALEIKIIEQAKELLKEYQDNFIITQMPSPTNELVKNTIREQVILNDIGYVFFDYVFISPALINEFRGTALRNDELLLILTTTLKNLAQELNVFVMSGTQVNANADDNKNIRNEASLAGGRSQINKADYGFIMSRPTVEELGVLEPITARLGVIPNMVTDVFKVRSGEWTQVRIWQYFDYGILRRQDLFMTDSRLNVVNLDNVIMPEYEDWENEERMKRLERLNCSIMK